MQYVQTCIKLYIEIEHGKCSILKIQGKSERLIIFLFKNKENLYYYVMTGEDNLLYL